jgi:hypothetical protein
MGKKINNKILIIGHARHGKDTVAGIMAELFGLRFESSSAAASRIFLFDALKDKYDYQTPAECFDDRLNHRAEWFDLIVEYNKNDKARLAKEILKTSDGYIGMRSAGEINECLSQGLFNLIIGVYDDRKPLEPKDSFDFDLFDFADIVIHNNSTLEELKRRVKLLKPLL